MYVCMYMYIYIYVYIYMHTYVNFTPPIIALKHLNFHCNAIPEIKTLYRIAWHGHIKQISPIALLASDRL